MQVTRVSFYCALVAMLFAPGMAHAQVIGETFQTEFFENTVIPGEVSVTLTDHEGTVITPFVNQPVAGLVSYVGRPKFDARTGGANAQQDAGPVSITYDDGGTMTTVNYPIEPLGTAPGPQVFTNTPGSGPALSGDGFIRVADNFNSLTNDIAWDTAYSGAFDSMTMDYQIRLQSGTAANDNADGFGFMYFNQDPGGSSGAVYTSGEEPSGAGLGVGFDIWDNGTEGGNSVSLHYNGMVIGSVDVTAASPNREAFLESGQPISVNIVAGAGEGVVTPPVLQPMSSFSTSATRSPALGGLMPMADVDPGPGVHDAYYRLTGEVNDQGNYLTFDAVPGAGSRPGFGARTGGANEASDIDNISVSYEVGKVNASFDFRITNVEGDPADGMSFVLASTALYGDTGVVDRLTDGDGVGWEVAEDPRLAGSFGMAFKTFDADELRIRFDGADVANIAADALPDSFLGDTFVDGQWHSANISVMDMGPDADITISLDDTVVFSGLVAGAAGLALVPEPSSLSLLAIGVLGGLRVVRRNRRKG